MLVGIYRGIIILGLLGWCRISSIHSMGVLRDPPLKKERKKKVVFLFGFPSKPRVRLVLSVPLLGLVLMQKAKRKQGFSFEPNTHISFPTKSLVFGKGSRNHRAAKFSGRHCVETLRGSLLLFLSPLRASLGRPVCQCAAAWLLH